METIKVLKGIGVVAVAVGLGMAAGANMFPKEVSTPGPIQYVDKEVIKEVPVTVEKVVEKTVEVTDSKYADFVQYVYDNDGKLEFLTADLDDKEVSKIADRYVADIEFKKLAVDSVKKDLFDELDGTMVTLLSNATVQLDDHDMEGLKVDDGFDEIVVDSIDFDDMDGEYVVTGKFRQDDNKFKFSSTVSFKDGEYDDLTVDTVTNYN